MSCPERLISQGSHVRRTRQAGAGSSGALGHQDHPQPAVVAVRPDATGTHMRPALACDGWLRTDTQAMLIRFVDGRPVSLVTTQFLGWLAARWAADGTQALCIVWDHASWHVSCAVRTWMKAHHPPVKRAIAEPTRKLTGAETKQRICTDYHCELLAPIAQKVA
jgi:hypothetical protein